MIEIEVLIKCSAKRERMHYSSHEHKNFPVSVKIFKVTQKQPSVKSEYDVSEIFLVML